jgi:transposase
MPQLTDFQKTILQTRIHDGGIIRNIAAELGVSSSTVLRAKNKIAQTGTIIRRQGSRRKRASTAEQDSDLVNFLRRHPFKDAIMAKQQTDFPTSVVTARRRIAESELRNRSAAFLTEENKRNRIAFAREHIRRPENFWDNAIFSDEKTFQSCNNGKVQIHRPQRMGYDPQFTRKIQNSGRFSVNA